MSSGPLHRKHQIDRIQSRIDRLGGQAAELLTREEAALTKVHDLREAETGANGAAPARAGRLRSVRRNRALRRAERAAEELRTKRESMVEGELLMIMLALEKQSRRTRERLDEELERLAPIEEEWERLRSTFDALETAVTTPALEALAGQWRGELQIPEFPVREREGYPRPFPARALLF
jgi:chromosome segregation ATPase